MSAAEALIPGLDEEAKRERRAAYDKQRRSDPEVRAREAAYSRKYYLANREALIEQHRGWRLANPEKARKNGRERYQQWYASNREKAVEKARRWRLANPKKARAADRIRWATDPEYRKKKNAAEVKLYRAQRIATNFFKITAAAGAVAQLVVDTAKKTKTAKTGKRVEP